MEKADRDYRGCGSNRGVADFLSCAVRADAALVLVYDAKAARRSGRYTLRTDVRTCVSTGGTGEEIAAGNIERHAKRANKEIRHPGEI